MIKAFLTGLTVASVMFFAGCDSKEVVETKPEAAPLTANLNTKTLKVQKMNCGGCAAKVKKVLAKVEGMKIVKTDPKSRTVEIAITDESKFEIEKAITAIKEDIGWEATLE